MNPGNDLPRGGAVRGAVPVNRSTSESVHDFECVFLGLVAVHWSLHAPDICGSRPQTSQIVPVLGRLISHANMRGDALLAPAAPVALGSRCSTTRVSQAPLLPSCNSANHAIQKIVLVSQARRRALAAVAPPTLVWRCSTTRILRAPSGAMPTCWCTGSCWPQLLLLRKVRLAPRTRMLTRDCLCSPNRRDTDLPLHFASPDCHGCQWLACTRMKAFGSAEIRMSVVDVLMAHLAGTVRSWSSLEPTCTVDETY